jgi:signal transduction histidine kinase
MRSSSPASGGQGHGPTVPGSRTAWPKHGGTAGSGAGYDGRVPRSDVESPPEIARRLAEEMAATSELLVDLEDLDEILRRLALRARQIVNAEYAAISTFDEAGVLERFVYAGIDDEQARKLGAPPVGRGLLGELANHDRPLRLEDLKTHPRFTGWPEAHPDMRAFLGVPIRASGRTIGSLYMTRTEGAPPFTAGDELAASMMALQAAVSLASALARARSGRVALLEERERIAHDLHDGTIQALYALGLEVDSITHQDALPAPTRETLVNAVQRINEVIGDIRTYISVLEAKTPHTTPELTRDLNHVIRQTIPEGIDVVVNITAPALQELGPREVEDLIYIAREALSNAVRHGPPTKVAVDLRQSATETALTIQDNGPGFDPEQVRAGFGTITMRTRAARLGADLKVLSIPGMGTTVRVAIPRVSMDYGDEELSGANRPAG